MTPGKSKKQVQDDPFVSERIDGPDLGCIEVFTPSQTSLRVEVNESLLADLTE